MDPVLEIAAQTVFEGEHGADIAGRVGGEQVAETAARGKPAGRGADDAEALPGQGAAESVEVEADGHVGLPSGVNIEFPAWPELGRTD